MGMDLVGLHSSRFGFSWSGWHQVLKIAWNHGWAPSGTTPPTMEFYPGQPLPTQDEWSGTYFSNDAQWVESEDAKGIAAALELALGAGSVDDISVLHDTGANV